MTNREVMISIILFLTDDPLWHKKSTREQHYSITHKNILFMTHSLRFRWNDSVLYAPTIWISVITPCPNHPFSELYLANLYSPDQKSNCVNQNPTSDFSSHLRDNDKISCQWHERENGPSRSYYSVALQRIRLIILFSSDQWIRGGTSQNMDDQYLRITLQVIFLYWTWLY